MSPSFAVTLCHEIHFADVRKSKTSIFELYAHIFLFSEMEIFSTGENNPFKKTEFQFLAYAIHVFVFIFI